MDEECTCNHPENIHSAKSMPLVDHLKGKPNQQLEDEIGEDVEIAARGEDSTELAAP